MIAEEYAKALAAFQQQEALAEKDEVFVDMERAMLLHLTGEYQKSNLVLDGLEQRIDELFTKSLTTEAGSYFTNDNSLPYEGEDFEKVMVNLIGALNYVYLGEWNEALVEVRKVDHKLNLFHDKYQKQASFRLTEKSLQLLQPQITPLETFDQLKSLENQRFPTQSDFVDALTETIGEEARGQYQTTLLTLAEETIYKEDAWARYLSGILYEGLDEENDAFIAYRKAYEIYQTYQKDYGTPIPGRLKLDLLRVTQSMGLEEEYQEYKRLFAEVKELDTKIYETHGELVFISYNDLSPIKIQHTIRIPVPVGTRAHFMKFAFPRFATRTNRVAYAEVTMSGAGGSTAEIPEPQRTFEVENLGAIAIKDMDDRIGRIRTKAIGRATAKFVAVKSTEEGVSQALGALGGFITGTAGNIVANISERIDKRSWRLLPGKIHLGRIIARPGVYQIGVKYYANNGDLLGRRKFDNIKIEAKQKTFVRARFVSAAEG